MSNHTDKPLNVSPVTKQSQSISELEFVITPITIPTQISSKQFASLIKTANDSGSFNISLEFKSISQNTQQNPNLSLPTVRLTDLPKLTTAIEKRNTIHSVIADGGSIKNVDVTSMLFASNSNQFSNLLSCSTPIKSTVDDKGEFHVSHSDSLEKCQLNTLIVFNDDTTPSKTPGKRSMLIENNCRTAERTLIASDRDHSRNVQKSKSFNRSWTPITVAKLAVRRNSRNTRRSKVFKFFTQKRPTPKLLFRHSTKKRRPSQNVRHCNDGVPSDDTDRSASLFADLGCIPLLTTENVNGFSHRADTHHHESNDLDFSFVCEPSTSDIEADELDYSAANAAQASQLSGDTSKLVITIDRCLSNFDQNTDYIEAQDKVKRFPRKLSKSGCLSNSFVRQSCSKFEKKLCSSNGLTGVS